jgi:flagellar hook-basal body complex protein FliE
MYSSSKVIGNKIDIQATNPKHFGFHKTTKYNPDNVIEDFAHSIKDALSKVNDLQNKADELTMKMIYEPESVETYDVMIAAEKAKMAISFTRTIRDYFVKGFKEIISLR